MLNIFKNCKVVGCLFLMTLCSHAQGEDFFYERNQFQGDDFVYEYDCDQYQCPSFYVGFFGGGGGSCDAHVNQRGIAFYPDAEGGPLDVNANGSLRSAGAAIGGVNIGYQLQQMQINKSCGWSILPAIELEGYYLTRLGNSKTGDLINITDRLPEHDFINTLPMDSGVFLANGVVAFNIPCLNCLQPYVGAGVGAAKIWISGAKSEQFSPPEAGINHFNSRTRDSDWAFAVQAKVGLRYNLSCNWNLFAEYRFLHVNPTDYTFGDTRYPNHVPTSNWNVHLKGLNYNLGVVGIQYTFGNFF